MTSQFNLNMSVHLPEQFQSASRPPILVGKSCFELLKAAMYDQALFR
jgi:hypothetical protein